MKKDGIIVWLIMWVGLLAGRLVRGGGFGLIGDICGGYCCCLPRWLGLLALQAS